MELNPGDKLIVRDFDLLREVGAVIIGESFGEPTMRVVVTLQYELLKDITGSTVAIACPGWFDGSAMIHEVYAR